MTRKAVVASVGDSWIDVLALDEEERAHDEACGHSAACGTTGCGCRVTGRPFRAANPRGIDIRTGDTVVVDASTARAVGGALTVLVVPLALAAAGWFVLKALVPGGGDGVGVLGIILGLALGWGGNLIAWFRRREEKLPIITAVAGE